MNEPPLDILCLYGDGPQLGTGHRVRMERLASVLGPHTVRLRPRGNLEDLKAHVRERAPSVVVWDGRENPMDQVAWCGANQIPTVVIDSQGPERNVADLVVEGLPSLEGKEGMANLKGLSWLPPSTWKRVEETRGILAYGGGLAPGDETDAWVDALMNHALGLEPPVGALRASLTLILPEKPQVSRAAGWVARGHKLGFSEVHFLARSEVRDFDERIGQCARLVTYYGLTAFEAISRGLDVRLLSPRKVHADLSERHLARWHLGMAGGPLHLASGEGTSSPVMPLGGQWGRWADLVRILAAHRAPVACPVCGSRSIQRKSRRPAGNLWQCRACHLFFMEEVFPPSFWGEVLPPHAHGDYGEAYFTTEYIRAYGKTYAEDRPAIARMARGRLETLRRWVPAGKVLDVGSALGFFLDEARELGYETHGIEMSPWAVTRTSSAHRVQAGSVLDLEPQGPFDAVTLWYVLEHFRDVHELVKRLDRWVNPGGILAFSTPHGRGLSARFLTDSFLATSPDDHYFIYSTANLKELLEPLGYQLVHHGDTGVHPGRFKAALPVLGRLLPEGAYRWWAKAAHWGDTGEWYFRKGKDR